MLVDQLFDQLIAQTFRPTEVYFLAALLYLVLVLPLSQISRYVERVVERRLGLGPGTEADKALQALNIQAEARAG